MSDETARQTFERLLSNILAHVRRVPVVEQDRALGEARDALQSIAARQGLSAAQAASWAKEIENEVRFRLVYERQDVSNDNH